MRRLRGAALLLCLAASVRAQTAPIPAPAVPPTPKAPTTPAAPAADPRSALAELARKAPNAPFTHDDLLPERFRGLLRSKGYPSKAWTNKRVLDEYDSCEKSKREESPDAWTPPPIGQAPKPDSHYGLNFLGFEFGTGQDNFLHDMSEPYQKKGINNILDWNIRPNITLDGLGARLDYRHPPDMRSLSVGFLKYWDWPAGIGLGQPRDTVYSWLGQTPDKPTGGIQMGASGVVNQWIGGRTVFDSRQGVVGNRTNDYTTFTVGGGYSPLGDNTGKRWNITLLGDLINQKARIEMPGYDVNVSGFGYSAGAAFQVALNGLWKPWDPFPPTGPLPAKGADKGAEPQKIPWIEFDRYQTKLLFSQTPTASFGITTINEVQIYLFQHFILRPGISVTYMPDPQPQKLPDDKPWSVGFNLGMDLKF
jgi:hypothetical protein